MEMTEAREVLKQHLIGEGIEANRIILPGLDESVALSIEADAAPVPVQEKRSRVAPADMATDWYNDYAALLLKLGRQLEDMTDTNERRALLAKLNALL